MDARKLILGKYYDRCKNKEIPVSNMLLSHRLSELQEEGYLKDCSLEDLISMCELKPIEKKCLQHIPSTISPTMGKSEYNKLLKELDLEHVEPSGEPLECPICLEELDDENKPIERLSPCGHYAHHSCIFKTSKGIGKDPFCPMCNVKIDNVKPPSKRELEEGKRQLFAQYTRALVGESEVIKEDQFKSFVLDNTYIIQPFINTMKLIGEWNLNNPTLQIRQNEYDEYKKIASSAYKNRYYRRYDPDVDEELKEYSVIDIYDLIVENILQYLPLESVTKLGPLEIEDIWNENSIYTIKLENNIHLYDLLNSYREMAEKKYKVDKKFNELYQTLLDFDNTNNTDISSRVKAKYDTLRNKEDKKNLIPGTLVEKEIFNKPFDKLKKEACIIM